MSVGLSTTSRVRSWGVTLCCVSIAALGEASPLLSEAGSNLPVWTERKGLLVMLQSPQGQASVDHELGALPLDWVEPKPLPKI